MRNICQKKSPKNPKNFRPSAPGKPLFIFKSTPPPRGILARKPFSHPPGGGTGVQHGMLPNQPTQAPTLKKILRPVPRPRPPLPVPVCHGAVGVDHVVGPPLVQLGQLPAAPVGHRRMRLGRLRAAPRLLYLPFINWNENS